MKWGEISRFLLYKSSKNKQTKVNLRIKGEKAGKQKIVFQRRRRGVGEGGRKGIKEVRIKIQPMIVLNQHKESYYAVVLMCTNKKVIHCQMFVSVLLQTLVNGVGCRYCSYTDRLVTSLLLGHQFSSLKKKSKNCTFLTSGSVRMNQFLTWQIQSEAVYFSRVLSSSYLY